MWCANWVDSEDYVKLKADATRCPTSPNTAGDDCCSGKRVIEVGKCPYTDKRESKPGQDCGLLQTDSARMVVGSFVYGGHNARLESGHLRALNDAVNATNAPFGQEVVGSS